MATFGKGVEYALHCLLYLHDQSSGTTVRVSDIAQYQGISETYLAKIFTMMKKAGLVRSSIGAKGGFELARPGEQITFWDVVEAVEGKINLFECRNIRANSAIYRELGKEPRWSGPCEIHKVMLDVEEQITQSLKAKTLAWLAGEVGKKFSAQEKNKIALWFLEKQSNK